VPVARTILACEDGSVLGAPFYLAERLRGVVLQDGIPEAFRDPHVVAAVADLAVDTLAAIHGVTWKTLDVPYRPGNYLQRQIRRWTGQLELTPTASRLSGLDRVTRWIIENLPESGGSTIVHGDYGLHNMILQAPPGVRIMAVLDWEMATIGDPLADLAWFLSGWGQSQEDEGVRNPANVIATWPGAPDRFALQRRYEMATGRKIENWNFYEVFTLWKGTIITEGLYSAYVSGTAANQAVVRFETQVPEQVERLLGLISVQGTC
jgi:aminoglycoside phosphotransferase (APT) family kinase protein